jgi:hypothetical protein
MWLSVYGEMGMSRKTTVDYSIFHPVINSINNCLGLKNAAKFSNICIRFLITRKEGERLYSFLNHSFLNQKQRWGMTRVRGWWRCYWY